VYYHRGWIPERFDEVKDLQFAFVHVDVDLHEPTRDSLVYFYERLVPGGILLCDDYGSAACPGAKQAFDELIADKPERSVIHLPTGQGFIVKRGPSVRVARSDTRNLNEESRAS
jgi:O-methyltransferase